MATKSKATTPPKSSVTKRVLLGFVIALGVIPLVGLSAFIYWLVFSSVNNKHKAVAEANQDVSQIQTVLEGYYSQHGSYPEASLFYKGLFSDDINTNSVTGIAYQYHPEGCSYTLELVSSPLAEGLDTLKTWQGNHCN